ncbi:MAG TPA: septation protein SepH [Actinomycetota bacterium]|nr:septation protein SepH [Actinomycetota bacterium]
MDRLRVLGPTSDGDGVVLIDDEEGARFVVPLDELIRFLSPVSGSHAHDPPEHHVRVVPAAEARGGRRVGGLAPGAFRRATSAAPPARLQGVRALIGDGGAAMAEPAHHEMVSEQDPHESQPALPDEPRLVRTTTTRLGAGEIQALLRAGRTVADVSSIAGAPEDWVARLERTVERERTVLVGQMLHERLERPEGPSGLNLGGSIAENLGARGVPDDALDTGWSARRESSGPWRVRFAYQQGGLGRQAEWSYDPKTRDLQALDEGASRLGWVPPVTG